jgi:hypothetical protein
MRVDPEVCAKKFATEVSILDSQKDLLRSLGCYIVRVQFPEIDALLVPTRKLAIAFPEPPPGRRSPTNPNLRQYQLLTLPGLDFATPMAFGVRFGLDDYDLRAPSLTFRHPTTWQLLPHAHIPAGVHIVKNEGMNVVHATHPVTGAPFFCLAGVREYHEHPQHTGDDWLLYREDINVFATLMSVIRCCCRDVAPVFVIRIEGQQLGLNVDWVR